jgi:hypothetical protein
MSQIFLSYSREDIAMAESIAKDLKNLGHDVYVATSEIKPGQDFVQEVTKAINRADVIIPLVTKTTITSKWSLTELGMALGIRGDGSNLTVIPVVFDNVDIPLQLKQIQCIRADSERISDLAITISYSIAAHNVKFSELKRGEYKNKNSETAKIFTLSIAAIISLSGMIAIMFPNIKNIFEIDNTLIFVIVSGIGISIFSSVFLRKGYSIRNDNTHGKLTSLSVGLSEDDIQESKIVEDEQEDEDEIQLMISKVLRKIKYQQRITTDRLVMDSKRNYNRSTLSLIFGTSFAGFGLVSLLVLINTRNTNDQIMVYIQQNMPRFSLVVLIEVLALFFLRLYKDNIAKEIELRCEISEIELKFLGAKIAIISGDRFELNELTTHFELNNRPLYDICDSAKFGISKNGFILNTDNSVKHRSKK